MKVPQIKNNVNEIIKIKNSGTNTAEIYFYGDIVSDSWGAWTDEDQYPDNIKNLLKEHEGKNLDIFINSGGGSVGEPATNYDSAPQPTQAPLEADDLPF